MARTNDDLIDIAAGQHAECALMQIHDGQVGSPPLHHIVVRVQPHQQEVPLCPSQLHVYSFLHGKLDELVLISPFPPPPPPNDFVEGSYEIHCLTRPACV